MAVNLSRLIAACERVSVAALEEPRERRRQEAFLSHLHAQWLSLASLSHNGHPSLNEFRRKIEHLADVVEAGKMRCGGGGQAHNQPHLSRAQANGELCRRISATSRVEEARRQELVSGREGRGGREEGREAGREEGGGREGGIEVERDGGEGSSLKDTLRRARALPPLPSHPLPAVHPAAESERVAHGGGSASAAAVARGLGSEGGSEGRGGEDGEMDRLHDVQRQLQESLIGETAQMAAQLRERSLLSRKAITSDSSTLDSTTAVCGGDE